MCQVGELLEASQVGELLEVQVHLPTNKHFATTTLLQAFKNNHNQINAVQCYFCYCFLLYCCCYFGLVCSVKCLTMTTNAEERKSYTFIANFYL